MKQIEGVGKMIKVSGLSKSFGNKKILSNINFTLQQGECVLLLGPNGAGKTTLLRLIMELYKPDRGEIHWSNKARNKSEVGWILQDSSLIDRVTVKELIQYICSLHKDSMSPEEVLATSGLVDQRKVLTERLSIGQKRRLLFALALAGKPNLLIMDEPTAGMDVEARKSFCKKIVQLKNQGMTILMTTHLMHEASLLSDRILMLQNGSLTCDQDVQTISRERHIVKFTLENEQVAKEIALHYKILFNIESSKWEVETQQPDECVKWMVQEGIPFQELEISQRTIEQFYEEIVKKEGDFDVSIV